MFCFSCYNDITSNNLQILFVKFTQKEEYHDDVKTGAFPSDDIQAQTRQSLENIKAILAAEGLTMADVCKTTVLLQDIADFAAMNEVYAEYFTEPYPARAAFQVAALPKGAKVEIEAVASK